MEDWIHKVLSKAHKCVHWIGHQAETIGHCTYLSFVSVEAHGYYGKAALVLLAIILIKELWHVFMG